MNLAYQQKKKYSLPKQDLLVDEKDLFKTHHVLTNPELISKPAFNFGIRSRDYKIDNKQG